MSGYGDEWRAAQCSFCALETLLRMSGLQSTLLILKDMLHSQYVNYKDGSKMEWNIFPHSFDVKISLELHIGAALQIA